MVTASYSTNSPEDGDEVLENPLDRPSSVAVGTIKSSWPTEVDINGNAIENTAGKPFFPRSELEVNDLVITVEHNVAVFNGPEMNEFTGAVNSDEWYGFDPGQVRVADISYVFAIENGYSFWKRAIEVHLRKKTSDYAYPTIYPWQEIRPSKGLMEKNAEGKQALILDSDGNPISEPVFLDSTGKAIDPPDTTKIVLIRTELYPLKSFATLNLGV